MLNVYINCNFNIVYHYSFIYLIDILTLCMGLGVILDGYMLQYHHSWSDFGFHAMTETGAVCAPIAS